MKTGYVVIAVVVALVVGFAVGTITSGDGDGNGDGNDAALTRDDTTGTTDVGTDPSTESPAGEEGSDLDGGTERAPESADDPRPPAPDDVIGDRPGGSGTEDGQ